jgi:hypothetical protein
LQKEKFYITVFNPQLNIRDSFTDFSVKIPFFKSSYSLVVPHKIITLFVRCLDPNFKDWHLIDFKVSAPKADSSYNFILSFISPRKCIIANYKGWHEGLITSKLGFTETPLHSKLSYIQPLTLYKNIPKNSLRTFLPNHIRDSAIKNFNLKFNALKSMK